MTRVIKHLLTTAALVLVLVTTTFADPTFPKPQGMVNDFAGKLSPATKQQIDTLLRNFRDHTGIEVAIVTIPFDDMQGYPIEDYTLRLGRDWGIGSDSQKRSLVLLVAIKEPDDQGRYHGGTRLEVSRHLEGDVPDILGGELIRKMRNDFSAGRFDQALTTGTQTILATLAQRLGISMDGIDSTQAARQPVRRPEGTRGRGRSGGIPIFAIIIIGFVLFAIIRGFFGGRRGGGGGRGGGIGSDWLLWAILFGNNRGGGFGGFGSGSDSSWGGGSWGGGGSGDFGGFGGGGDFGGGGASDSW